MKFFEKRREKKRVFKEQMDKDIKLLIEYGYIKIDPNAKKPTYKEFEAKMKEWGFIK